MEDVLALGQARGRLRVFRQEHVAYGGHLVLRLRLCAEGCQRASLEFVARRDVALLNGARLGKSCIPTRPRYPA
jgi:hypothetical protein